MMKSKFYLGLSAVVFQFSDNTGFTLQVRRKANAQIFTGLFTSIRQPFIISISINP